MAKFDFEWGHAIVDDFFWWINERHRIYLARQRGDPKPWTDDAIMQRFKFCNVFRELDRGTRALKLMIQASQVGPVWRGDEGRLIFNICWYRLFNRWEHAYDIKWCETFDELNTRMRMKADDGDKIVTSAHMVYGEKGRTKLDSLLDAAHEIWGEREDIADLCLGLNATMEEVFEFFLRYRGVGKFIAYEFVTDLVQTPLLEHATDQFMWANMGPGCKRGLQRLGMEQDVESLRHLWRIAPKWLDGCVSRHHPNGRVVPPKPPIFALREIEHSLCEFDKYQRAVSGKGRPRERYDGSA